LEISARILNIANTREGGLERLEIESVTREIEYERAFRPREIGTTRDRQESHQMEGNYDGKRAQLMSSNRLVSVDKGSRRKNTFEAQPREPKTCIPFSWNANILDCSKMFKLRSAEVGSGIEADMTQWRPEA
jgi:hypothetical protein